MTTAFQADAFQNNAFQIDIVVAATGGGDTSDPLFYEWWRKQAQGKKEDAEQLPELREEITELLFQPSTAPISPELVAALAGKAGDNSAAAIKAARNAIVELKRLMDERDDEEAIGLLIAMMS